MVSAPSVEVEMSVMLSHIFTDCIQRITNIGLVVITHNQGMRITSQDRAEVYRELVNELGGSSLEMMRTSSAPGSVRQVRLVRHMQSLVGRKTRDCQSYKVG